MASVNFQVIGTKNPSNVYCRFLHTRKIDIGSNINVFVNPVHWDKKNQKIKNVIAVKNREAINRKLSQLKIDIVDNFNLAFMNGEIIDKEWLVGVVNGFFKRPKEDDTKRNTNHTIYYVEFAQWWLDEKASTWLASDNSYMSERVKQQYQSFLDIVKEFVGNSKIKLSDSGHKKIMEFIFWMNEQGYGEGTIKRQANRFKFFFLRAKQKGFKIDATYEQRVFVPKAEEILEPILDPIEIQTIFNLKIDSDVLDNARDNLIIACWTGLRVSDYLNKLDISNFIDDVIEITTTKTKTKVAIPVHSMVKRILIKHNGKLPKKVNDADFNKQIKKVCALAKINKEMKGRVYNAETKRKVVGLFSKDKLITSHIGRRSFATNHFGKLPNSVIMGICGWSKEEMMLNYIKKSNLDHATQLRKYWETTYKNE